MTKPGLEALLGGARRVSAFFATAWPNEPFVVHGARARLAGLVDVPELSSVEAMRDVPCHAVLAQSQTLGAHRFGNVAVDPAVAPSLLSAAVTLYFNEPRWPSRSLWRWVTTLEKELGLARGVLRPSAFFSSPGRGARMHFDCTESFVVQVRGRKTWTLARNDALPWPPVNYLEGEPLPPELRGLVRGPLKAPKSGRVRVVMKPGSVMYLPRGWWHSTHTSEPSVHLDLLGALPTWADAARVQLDAALRDEVWRSPMVRPDERMGALLLETLSRRFRRSSR